MTERATAADKIMFPATMVFGLCFVFGGWWVMAQDARIDKNTKDIEALQQKTVNQQISLLTELNALSTQQELQTQALQNMAKTLEKLERKIESR